MTIRIASRSSKLALKQVEIFSKAFLLEDYKLVEVLTSGDKMSAKGEVMFDKANFVNEIEQMIQKNSVDIAIHSAKDMPAQETEGLKHFYFIETQKRKINDLIIFRNDTDTVFEKNMKLGTSSLRRIMQAKFHMNAKNIQLLNGNIDTRIKKLNIFISVIIGSLLGLISGIVGIGGGIFLSPILFLLKADKPKNIITTASLFILVNSISGIFGQFTKDDLLNEFLIYWPLFFGVFIGGLIGNYLNLKIFSNRVLALITSFLVIFVAARMAFKIFF